jgi:flagellar hook assembly protein FlgD
MKPTKEGQIVKYHTPYPDEDPNQLYVVFEVKEDGERSRANIKALNTGFSLASITTVRLNELEVVKISTADLVGHTVKVIKSDNSHAEGRVIKVKEQKIFLDLTKGINGVETNVWLNILDKNGIEHTGILFVK